MTLKVCFVALSKTESSIRIISFDICAEDVLAQRPRVRGVGRFFPPEITIAQRTERRRAAAGDAEKVVVAAAKNKRKRSNQRANVCFVGSSHSLPETAITRETKRETIDIG